MRKIKFFDTTLRDGAQAPGNSMSADDKVELFNYINTTGIDMIEVGFPASSKDDFNAIQRISGSTNNTQLCVFSRAIKNDIKIARQSLTEVGSNQIQIALTGSEVHLEHKRKISSQKSIAEAIEAINAAKSVGFKNISVGLEDATRGSYSYLKKIIENSISAGANTIVLADTVGYALPNDINKLVSFVRSFIHDEIAISIHCHNDLGLATANSLAAIEAGADWIQTTFAGIGERAGNTAIEEVTSSLHVRRDYYRVNHNINMKNLYSACNKIMAKIHHIPSRNKPILGENAFSTEAGIHIHGMLSNPITYEVLSPELFGEQRKLVLGKHSGKSMIKKLLTDYGIKANNTELEKISNVISESSNIEMYTQSKNLLALYNTVRNTGEISKD